MTRLRSAAQRAPQTKEQALALADRFAMRAAELAIAQADRDAELQKIHAVSDAITVPIELELKDIAKQLKPWWAANIETLTGGKRKSIELGGCLIGYRIGSPSVKFDGGNDDAMVEALNAAQLLDLLRTKQSPDKPAILAQLDGDAAEQLLELGFSISQPETFFIDRLRPSSADVRTIEAA